MCHISRSKSIHKVLHVALMIPLVLLSTLSLGTTQSALAQGGAPDSTITLQMPFIAGETWTVGGTTPGSGNFYGEGDHTNANNDYYATDWNRPNDLGAALLPVADGVVSAVAAPNPDCPNTPIGCFVQIDHADGYRTKYGHMSAVSVTVNSLVRIWTLIGRVGNSGTNTTGSHLHLTFRRNGTSYCWNIRSNMPQQRTPPISSRI